jgi:adenylyltransferase/sulfurtransferase
VLGAVPGVVGALQATEALKWILGVGEPLVGRLLQLDLRTGTTRTVTFDRRAGCECESGDIGSAPAVLTAQRGDTPRDIEPADLARSLVGEVPTVQLLDIREPWEWAVARIGDPTLLPLGDLEEQVTTLDPDRELVVYCHHGTRSSVATDWLRARGYRARNLAGGIDRWSREVDPSVPRY